MCRNHSYDPATRRSTGKVCGAGDRQEPPFEKLCDECQREVTTMRAAKSPVSRQGSTLCKSYSVASGGDRTYCTCDTCF